MSDQLNQPEKPGEKPIILRTVKYNQPLTEAERQAYYKMTPAEKQQFYYNRYNKQNLAAWPKNPLNNQHVVNQAISQDISIYPTLPKLGVHGYEYQQQNPNRPLGFWENPQRIARLKQYIDKNPTESLPDWLDKNVVNTAYEYLNYANQYKPVSEWGALPANSPVSEALKQLPEPQFPSPIDQVVNETNDLENVVNPKDLTLYQRALYGFMTPQPGKVTGGNIAQTTLATVGTGGGIQFMLSKLSTLSQLLGITKNPGALASPAGIAGAVIFGSATWRGLQTGKELGAVETLKWLLDPPLLHTTKFGKSIEEKIDKFIDSKPGLREELERVSPVQFKYAQNTVNAVFNALSGAVAGIFGIVAQASAGDKDFSDVVSHLGAAYKAGKLAYVAYGKTANALLPLSGGKPLEEGKMWDISSGKPKPVDIPQGFTVGATALDELRTQIENDPDNWQKYKQDFISRFGVEGQLNDFVLQTFLDPLNIAPYTNAKAVEIVGRKTANPTMEFAGKFAQGNPIVDAIPFPFNGAVELLSGGKLQGSKGFVGAMDAYKNFLKGNIPANLKSKIPYKAPADYTRLEKMVAGLNEEGLPKNMMPEDPTKKAIQNAKELTPEAKALNFNYTLVDRLYYLWDLSGKDPDVFIKLIKASSQADPRMTADNIARVFEETGLAKDAMDYRQFNSPIAAALASGLKKAIDSGSIQEVLKTFEASAQNRANLKRYAAFFGLKESDLVKLAREGKTNFDSLIKTYSADPAKAEMAKTLFPNGDTSLFKTDMELFTKKDALPYSDSTLGFAIINKVSDSLDDFLKQRFGIAENDPWWMRVSHTMKGLQSLAVLSLNPRYFIYNAMNNIITRIATNNYGYTDFNKFVDTYEPFIARQDIEGGLSQDIINNLGFFMKNKNKTAKGQKVLGAFDKFNQKVADIFGFATKLSRADEKIESRQSFAVEYINAFNKVRRVEIPENILRILPEEVTQRLAKIIEGSTKVDQIDQAIAHVSDPMVAKEVVDRVLSNFANTNEKLPASADYYKELLLKTGIYDEIVTGLNNAKTVRDVADVFNNIESHWQDYLNKLVQNDIETRIPDVAARVKTEGFAAAMSELSDMYLLREQTIAGKWMAWDMLFSMKGIVDDATFNRVFQSQVKLNADEFKRMSDWQQATYDGLFEAMGKKNDPSSIAFLKAFKDSNDVFNQFFLEKTKLWEEFQSKKLEGEAWTAEYNATKAKADSMWEETVAKDFAIQAEADKAMIALSCDNPKVVIWRGELAKMRAEISKSMSDFRKRLTEHTTLTSEQKNAEYNKYITEEYMALQNKYKQFEMDGAQELHTDTQTQRPILEQRIAELEKKIELAKRGMTDEAKRNAEALGFSEDDIARMSERLIGTELDPSWVTELESLRNQLNQQPLGSTPATPNYGIAATEGNYAFLQGLLNGIKDNALREINNPKAKASIPQEAIPLIKRWIAQEKQNLASDKYFAQSWGESQRDFVMLNYTKKTNFDNAANVFFPYQFWYTNTMRNWALRMVDRPAIFNQYFRYRQAQENMERSGIPSRLSGKMSAFAPYLPDWMGDTLWSDPMGQLYPFSQALQPIQKIMGIQDDLVTSAGYALNDMVKAGKISKAQADEAKKLQSGALWEQAMAKATDESVLSDPSSIVSLMMQPGMQWDILSKLIMGHPEKISPTPAYKTGQAIEQLGSYAGVNIKPLTWLETNARKAIGMSTSVAKYGQFGDYYVERMLSNMAFEGVITAQEAKEGMITHSGSAWDAADKRVMEELTLKSPGMLPVVGAINGANFWQITTATFNSLFPMGLLPQGELIYKGEQQAYNLAWDRYKKGDKSALTDFYNEHPEYETRSALYTKDPEARLKQYFIGNIWDTYTASGKANQRLISDALGDDFGKLFLNGSAETQSMIPLETLAIWSKTIGNTIPKPEALPDFSAPDEVTNLEMWSKDITASYDQFVKEREALFPLYYALQSAYYEKPESERKAFLAANPSLKKYWEWKAQYEEDHPELSPVFASQSSPNVSKNPDVTLQGFDSNLLKALNDYYSTGVQMSAGAWELLAYEWEKAGRPYGTMKKWMSKVIEPAITGKSVPQDSFWNDSNSAIYGAYKTELDSLYPNYSALWDTYWGLPKGQRSAFWDANPQLAEAQAWKEEYEKEHPELKSILEYLSKKYGN